MESFNYIREHYAESMNYMFAALYIKAGFDCGNLRYALFLMEKA